VEAVWEGLRKGDGRTARVSSQFTVAFYVPRFWFSVTNYMTCEAALPVASIVSCFLDGVSLLHILVQLLVCGQLQLHGRYWCLCLRVLDVTVKTLKCSISAVLIGSLSSAFPFVGLCTTDREH
jgi:hypothetical protein